MSAPNSPEPPDQDAEHLRLLALFHRTICGLYGLFGFCGLPHFLKGLNGIAEQKVFVDYKGGPTASFYFGTYLFVVAAIILGAWALAILNWNARNRIEEHRATRYLHVLSVLNCLWMPIGTVLGVFTIVVMSRPTVRTLFTN